jgi:hypothetical protein
MQMVEFFKQWSENRTGFNRYSAGTDTDSLNKTKGGMELLTAKADMRTELIARFFAQGVRKMMAKLLKLAVKHQDKEDWFSVNGEWIAVNPSEWKDQYNVKINVGLGHGTNDQRLQRLMAMFGMQQMGAQSAWCGPNTSPTPSAWRRRPTSSAAPTCSPTRSRRVRRRSRSCSRCSSLRAVGQAQGEPAGLAGKRAAQARQRQQAGRFAVARGRVAVQARAGLAA